MVFAHLASGKVCLTTGSGCQVRSDDNKDQLPSLKYLHMSLDPPACLTRSYVALTLLVRV